MAAEGLELLLRQLAGPGVDLEAQAALDLARERLLSAPPRRLTLDRYELGPIIGQGGSGVVHRARDPALGRDVAIKLLTAPQGWGSSQARLVREARALAALSHPNVVAVYDVGTYDPRTIGKPSADATSETGVYMVLELLDGVSLAEWMRQRRSWREIVATFVEAGRGLAAAHERGLVHRDFKPSNTIVRSDGRVCVLDFGLVEAQLQPTGPAIDDEFRTAEGIVLGTPAYMAPEQHLDAEVDARADQYAFCASLWHALYGAPPFAARTLEALVSAKRRGPPAAPRRPAIPHRIRAALYRGLAARPSLRHEHMTALLARLTPPRRAWVVSLVGAALAGGVAVSAMRTTETSCDDVAAAVDLGWDEDRANDTRAAFDHSGSDLAATAFARVESEVATYAAQWREIRADVCRSAGDDAIVRLQVQCLDRAALDLRALADRLAFADASTVEHAARATAGLPHLDECSDGPQLSRLEPPPPDPSESETVAELRAGLASARALFLAGRVEASVAEVEAVAARSQEVDYAPVLAEIALAQGEAALRAARPEEAERLLREALRLLAVAPHPKIEAAAWASLLHAVGVGRRQTDDIEWLIDLARTHHAAIGSPPRLAAQLANTIASIRVAQNRAPEGVAELDAAIARATVDGPTDLVAPMMAARGMARRRAGDLAGALADFEHALARMEADFGPDHPQLAAPLTNVANVFADLEHFDRCTEPLTRAIAITERDHGATSMNVGRMRTNLAAYLYKQGDYDGSLAEAERGLAITERAAGPDAIGLAKAVQVVGLAHLGLGHHAEALAYFERAREIDSADTRPTDIASGHANAALALVGLRRLDEARKEIATAREITEKEHGPTDTRTLAVIRQQAEIDLDAGHADVAAALLEDALARSAEGSPSKPEVARIRLALAKAQRAVGRPSAVWLANARAARELLFGAASGTDVTWPLASKGLSARHRALLDELDALIAEAATDAEPTGR